MRFFNKLNIHTRHTASIHKNALFGQYRLIMDFSVIVRNKCTLRKYLYVSLLQEYALGDVAKHISMYFVKRHASFKYPFGDTRNKFRLTLRQLFNCIKVKRHRKTFLKSDFICL